MADLIDRQAAIEIVDAVWCVTGDTKVAKIWDQIKALPSAEPTLYGYKIEHLVFIARVMEKENIPPEKVIEVLKDVGRVVKMLLAEQKEIIDREVKRWTI